MKRYMEKLAVMESRRILNDDDDLVCITVKFQCGGGR